VSPRPPRGDPFASSEQQSSVSLISRNQSSRPCREMSRRCLKKSVPDQSAGGDSRLRGLRRDRLTRVAGGFRGCIIRQMRAGSSASRRCGKNSNVARLSYRRHTSRRPRVRRRSRRSIEGIWLIADEQEHCPREVNEEAGRMKPPKPGPSVYIRINVKNGRGLPFSGAAVTSAIYMP
jgi:hypothetical protein